MAETFQQILATLNRINDRVPFLEAGINQVKEKTTQIRQFLENHVSQAIASLTFEILQLRGGLNALINEIRRRLPDDIVNVFTQIVRDIVTNAVDQLTQQIQDLPATLMQQINVSLFATVDQIISVIRNVADQIEQFFTDLRAFIEQRIADSQELLQRFQGTLDRLNETLINTREAILERINTALTDITNYLKEIYDQWLREYWSLFGRVFESFVEEVRESFRTIEASITGLGFMLGEIELTLSGITKTLAVIGGAVTEIGIVLNGIFYEYGSTWSKTYDNTSNIINLINKLPDKLIERIEEKHLTIFLLIIKNMTHFFTNFITIKNVGGNRGNPTHIRLNLSQ
jgi:phage-related protein